MACTCESPGERLCRIGRLRFELEQYIDRLGDRDAVSPDEVRTALRQLLYLTGE